MQPHISHSKNFTHLLLRSCRENNIVEIIYLIHLNKKIIKFIQKKLFKELFFINLKIVFLVRDDLVKSTRIFYAEQANPTCIL